MSHVAYRGSVFTPDTFNRMSCHGRGAVVSWPWVNGVTWHVLVVHALLIEWHERSPIHPRAYSSQDGSTELYCRTILKGICMLWVSWVWAPVFIKNNLWLKLSIGSAAVSCKARGGHLAPNSLNNLGCRWNEQDTERGWPRAVGNRSWARVMARSMVTAIRLRESARTIVHICHGEPYNQSTAKSESNSPY